jgi:sec-independent protein translocase protein TatA
MFEGIFQPMHLLVILFVALLFFGPSKLAGLGKGMGEGLRGFKEALKDGTRLPQESRSPDSKS